MKESDWKIFTKIKEQALDEFCLRSLAEFQEIIDDKSKTPHERYLLNYRLVKNRDKKMGIYFDGHSRSNAWLQLLAMRGEGIANEELVAEMTEDFQRQTTPIEDRD